MVLGCSRTETCRLYGSPDRTGVQRAGSTPAAPKMDGNPAVEVGNRPGSEAARVRRQGIRIDHMDALLMLSTHRVNAGRFLYLSVNRIKEIMASIPIRESMVA